MGYFSNGTENMIYRAQYCDRCKHDENGNCPIILAHLLHNYEDCNKPESILHILIPRSADGLRNEACKMFIESEQQDDPRQEKLL